MKRVTNHREMAQLLCSESPDTEVTITLGDLQRMTAVAQITIRDQFAMAYATSGWHPHEVYERADMALKGRTK